jgi:hypothetical protein
LPLAVLPQASRCRHQATDQFLFQVKMSHLDSDLKFKLVTSHGHCDAPGT